MADVLDAQLKDDLVSWEKSDTQFFLNNNFHVISNFFLGGDDDGDCTVVSFSFLCSSCCFASVPWGRKSDRLGIVLQNLVRSILYSVCNLQFVKSLH